MEYVWGETRGGQGGSQIAFALVATVPGGRREKVERWRDAMPSYGLREHGRRET